MSKLPAFQFYPGDWRKDPGVQSLSYHDRGVWFEILLLMHESDERGKLNLNGKPMPVEALSRLLGLDNQSLTTTLTCLLEFGVASRCPETGSLVCRRMLRDENLRNIRKECGKLGGNPKLVKQKPTTGVKQKPTPSSSSSDEDERESSDLNHRTFQKPSLEDVIQYAQERKIEIDAEEFWNFYDSKGWMVGKNKMKKWRSCVAGWASRNKPKPKESRFIQDREERERYFLENMHT